ncbi:uncharacterized protein [Arachis hypogaea]|uniref:uncharacterized protein n=1 Tax=Arachis hypogaea TaxID=3818 RepID=UPI003B21E92F
MKKGIAFEWTPACEEAFHHFKRILSGPPVLGKPRDSEALYLYLAVTNEALATVLIWEEGRAQQPMYFVSKTLQGVELRYIRAEISDQSPGHGRLPRGGYGGPSRISGHTEEYEALISGLLLSKEVGVTRVEVNNDSQVVTSQINGMYQAKDPLLQKYLGKVKDLSKDFEEVMVQHVPREKNTHSDLLSKLASTKPGTGNRSLIQGLVKEPTVALCATRVDVDPLWVDPITEFLGSGKLPDDHKMAKELRREAAKYTIVQGQLFKRGLSQPLLKCLQPDQTDYVLREVHEGCCSHYIGGKALARKLFRAGYYWPTMMADAQEFIRRCKKRQENANFHKAPASELNLLMASRPFSQWGINLLGPFPVGPGQLKYLIVA